MCGVERDSSAAMIRWRADVALAEGVVEVEGAQLRGPMMVSSYYRYQLSHTGEEILIGEVRKAVGVRGAIPSLAMAEKAVFGRLQASGVVKVDVHCPED